jgi:general secretion pathway protein D
VVVNAATNTLIFKGNSEEHTQILNLLQELDKPTKAALIELTVAEVDLDANVSLGIDMLSSEMLKQGSFNVLSGGTYGLAIKYLAPGSTTAQDAIHALVTENRAKVLSSPRIMARNGETATIQVGQQVPIVTSQLGTAASSTGTGSSPNLLTAVQYKDVGIILKVKPVIYTGDRIELEVYQEVSDATSTSTGVTTSPTINTKKVETRLALKDGSTVMLGGLISNSQKASEQGVPYLKDIPWLGQLFRTNTTKDVQQELIILITPYTILDDHDAHTITDAFRNQLGSWAYRRDKDAPAGAH